jgi:SPP1 gp7 family putative phage head morphogenesis protein
VTRSRAELIARTETGRAASALTQARAEYIGSPGYLWRNANDYKVRPEIGIKHFAKLNTLAKGSHRKLEGTFHRWDDPPIAGVNGERAHPGSIYNCRCWAEPVLPQRY